MIFCKHLPTLPFQNHGMVYLKSNAVKRQTSLNESPVSDTKLIGILLYAEEYGNRDADYN